MGNRFGFRLVIALLAVATLVSVGFYSYNAGMARGVAESGRVIASPGGAAPTIFWPRPWGFGFGFPLFPLFFVFFWIFVLRGLFWRGGHWSRRWGVDGVPPAFEDWHRRIHERPANTPASEKNT